MKKHTFEHIVPTKDEDGKVTSLKIVSDQNLSVLLRPTPNGFRPEKVSHA